MKTHIIRMIYFYLVTFIGIVIFVIGTIQLLNLSLRTYIFKDADYEWYSGPVDVNGKPMGSDEEWRAQMEKNKKAQKQREASNAVAMIVVGYPLYAYHWNTLKREK